MELFCAYSHKDEEYRKLLETHLQPLIHEGIISLWYDRRIGAGVDWESETDYRLNRAHIIVLLMSPDFLASGYCYKKEMGKAMERRQEGVRVIPVILRPCGWQYSPISRLQVLPDPDKPVSKWEDKDEVFTMIAAGIRREVLALRRPVSHVLIGDPDLPRFEYMRRLIEGFFKLTVSQVKTFGEMSQAIESSAGELKFVLFTEHLPLSEQLLNVLPRAYCGRFAEWKTAGNSAVQIVFVFDNPAVQQEIGNKICDFFVPFPNSEQEQHLFLERLRNIFLEHRPRGASAGFDY